MNDNHKGLLAVIGIGVVVALYFATQDEDNGNDFVPSVQVAGELAGVGIGGSTDFSYNAGTPLDMRASVHFWDPGFNDRDHDSPQPAVQSCHRYPAVPGGNISTIMHKGWGAMNTDSPSDNDWRLNPPEVAVL